MNPPGNLEELGQPGREAWEARIRTALDAAIAEGTDMGVVRAGEHLRLDPGRLLDRRSLDWPALPQHAVECLGRNNALRLLDWTGDAGQAIGRLAHQDEYLEWRVVRAGDEIQRIEMTTELPEYWEVLAGYEPRQLLALARKFARTAEVTFEDLYGSLDPLTPGLSADELSAAFAATCLPKRESVDRPEDLIDAVGSINDGVRGLLCMIHRDNNLVSLFRLMVSSLQPHLVVDSVTLRPRFPSGTEAIGGIGAIATPGRNSDPLVVERLSRFATEGRSVAPGDPLGVYIRSLQLHALAMPDDSDVPLEWLHLSRGNEADEERGVPASFQRLTLEAPKDAPAQVGDLVVRRTGEPLRYGGQLAELVQLTLRVQTSEGVTLAPMTPVTATESESQCGEHRATWDAFVSAGMGS